MGLTELARYRQSRCQQQVCRLRLLVMSQDRVTLAGHLDVEVREVTNAVIAEVEAASCAVLGARRRAAVPEPFLWGRVTRLSAAADQAVDAARCGDLPALRAHIQHFDSLVSASWTVLRAVDGQRNALHSSRESDLTAQAK